VPYSPWPLAPGPWPLAPERLFSELGQLAYAPTGHASVRNGGASTSHNDAKPHPRLPRRSDVNSPATRHESKYSFLLVNEQDHGLAAITLRCPEVVTGSITSMSLESDSRQDHKSLELIRVLRDLGAETEYLLDGLIGFARSLEPVRRPPSGDPNRAFLISSGAFTEQELAETEASVARGSLELSAMEWWLTAAAETSSLEDAATFLRLTTDKIEAAVREDRLMAVDIAGELRVPIWQFNTRPVGRTLPHLESVIPLLRDWDWRTAGRFFATRQEDLLGHGRKTPASWLEDGGDVEEVKALIKHLHRW